MIFRGEPESRIKRKDALDDNIQKACWLVIGQRTGLLKSKLKQRAQWDKISHGQEAIALMSLIETVTFQFEDQQFLPLAVCQSKANLCDFQRGNMTNRERLQRFQNLVDVRTACNGQMHQAIVDAATQRFSKGATHDAPTAEQKASVQTASSKLRLATTFVHQSDRR